MFIRTRTSGTEVYYDIPNRPRRETCISPSIRQKLAENLIHPKLSVREMEILKLVADGQSNKEIGNELGITEGTVKTHVKSVLNKLGVPGRTAAIKEAIHRGLIHLG
jgi:two-component system NarL family response regulator